MRKGLNCCAKKRCEIFKGEKINLLLSHLAGADLVRTITSCCYILSICHPIDHKSKPIKV